MMKSRSFAKLRKTTTMLMTFIFIIVNSSQATPIAISALRPVSFGVTPIWDSAAEYLKNSLTFINDHLSDYIPLEFGEITQDDISDIDIPGWPDPRKVLRKPKILHETIIVSMLPFMIAGMIEPKYREAYCLMYVIGYLRQLSTLPAEEHTESIRDRVFRELSEMGYDGLVDWLKQNLYVDIDKQAESVLDFLDNSGLNPGALIGIVRMHDNVISRSRTLRIASEISGIDHDILQRVQANSAMDMVLFGTKAASVIEGRWASNEIELLSELLWYVRQIEGAAINILQLPDGRFYVYDEYALRRIAIGKDLELAVTKEGLEHLIKIDMSGKNGLFYDLSLPMGKDGLHEKMACKISNGILLTSREEKFAVWDKERMIYAGGKIAKRAFDLEKSPIDVAFLATMGRVKALRSQLETELENYRIFNRNIPIVVIDDSTPVVLKANAHTLKELSNLYGCQFIHLTGANREADQSAYAAYLANKYKQQLESRTMNPSIKEVLARNNILDTDGDINTSSLTSYLTRNAFFHISGVRNYTVLREEGIGKTVMNMDDDAPSETYTLRPEERQELRRNRSERRKSVVERMLRDVSNALNIVISNEEQLYDAFADPAKKAKLSNLENKYFKYSKDGTTGLVPQAVDEITPVSNQYVDVGRRLTHQRYQSLMMPLPEYLVRISDFTIRQPRQEKDSGSFMVLPVNVFTSSRLVGRLAAETDLQIISKDLRGTAGVPAEKQERKDIARKTIAYVPFPFILDQDTSAEAQFIRYLEIDQKIFSNLQHTNQKALIGEGVGGFIGDTYVIFNRAVFDNTIPAPSIGRALRLEEPPYILWVVSPMMRGKVTVAFSNVGGGQQRQIEERAYVISTQDYNEIVGGIARGFYETAVAEFYSLMERTPKLFEEDNCMGRLICLGENYIEVADNVALKDREIESILQARRTRAILITELGKQREQKQRELDDERANPKTDEDNIKQLESEIRDMDLIMLQYATDFEFYHGRNTRPSRHEIPNYNPANPDEDCFYSLKIKDGKIHWQAIAPDLKLKKLGSGRVIALETSWIKIKGREGVVDLSQPGKDEVYEVEIETKRSVAFRGIPEEGMVFIAPALVKSYEKGYIDGITNKLSDQIRSDGELILFWPDILEAAKKINQTDQAIMPPSDISKIEVIETIPLTEYNETLPGFKTPDNKSSSAGHAFRQAGTALSHLSDYEAERILTDSLLGYEFIGTPDGLINALDDAQGIVVYSDSLIKSPALQDRIRQSAGDSRKFFLVLSKAETMSADELLSSLNIDRDIFQRHVFTQDTLSADQLALMVASFLRANKIKQGRVFTNTEEDLIAWSKQGLVEALVMILKDRRFELISDYSQQHTEYIKTHQQALMAA
jgi:hypothetical protein